MYFLFFFFIFLLVVCPEGWQNYDQSCYKLIEEELSWDEASAYCIENSPYNYGHLATIHNDLENDFITYVVLKGDKVRTWIGANDKKEEGTFDWYAHNRELFFYSNWKDGEPNNAYDDEDCVEINRGGLGKWNDCKCKRTLRFVCEVELYTLSKGGSGLKELTGGLKADPRFPQ
ncbi:Galactose-specific lectin nattectin [Holothuria leucospilota]|uniref:Galactose-specific lectin nattectin n=1 Tax=Holothuria leucospilota TaxID=206669 RepID=A0A9Q1BZW8_HOLLE|nr:Galactose-specific lectin nattectin [Holothuria leucospilota]